MKLYAHAYGYGAMGLAAVRSWGDKAMEVQSYGALGLRGSRSRELWVYGAMAYGGTELWSFGPTGL